ncbi:MULTISPECIES: response regulator transcription factor [unclassified Streptomyces]|uniref:response regulator transcription factor n=1 Tax=unclassified Streptomyces TaxID=2593676 RepID=UPI002DD8C917|nr:response regulator transcription factor [Streptomyces sp. NBC_01750]WSB03083.1 response regulator transcription factor [Streptomyces sp. NBC_01794]WSD32671.1 response regulator transcription factor [Streptomyces sp. NBC_01750]
MLRSALAERLAGEPDLEVYDAPWRSAPGRARLLRPDVCAVDLDCSESYGIAPLGELPEGRTGTGRRPLLVLANANRPGPLRRAVEAHACGFVDNEGTPENLIAAIRKVAGGERFVDDSLGFGFLRASQIPLTKRELNVLSLAAEGASITDIANSLHLSNGTVRNYMAAITRKTGARNRVDAIRISQGEGWV